MQRALASDTIHKDCFSDVVNRLQELSKNAV